MEDRPDRWKLLTRLRTWWSRDHFAGAERAAAASLAGASGWFSPALLLLVAGSLYLSRLDAALLEPQEARYAEIPRQMLAEGQWLVPVLHCEPYLDKPPLLYWLVMACYQAFGVHDWAARLVPGLAGVLTVLVTFWWGKRVLGPRAGFLGALVLCLWPQFVYYGRMLAFDGLLGLWVAAGLAAAHVAVMGPRLHRGWWLTSAAACGLGLLTKGPVAVLLIAGPVLIHQFLEQRAARVGLRGWLAWSGVVIGVSAPWYIGVMAVEPGFFDYFFWRHHVQRFLTPFDHQEPAWFYLPGLLLGLLPWTLLLPGFIMLLTRRSSSAARRRPAALGMPLLAFAFGLGFFSAAGCKRPVYLVAVLPSLAIALGWYLDCLLIRPNWSALWQRHSRMAWIAALTAAIAGSGIAAAGGAIGMLPLWTAAALASAGVLSAVLLGWEVNEMSWASSAVLIFGLLLLGVVELLPEYNRRFSLRAVLQDHTHVVSTRQLTVFCYPQRWDSIGFYLPDAPVRVFGRDKRPQLLAELAKGSEVLLLVRSGKPLQELLRELPESVEYLADRRPGVVTAGLTRRRDSASVARRQSAAAAVPGLP